MLVSHLNKGNQPGFIPTSPLAERDRIERAGTLVDVQTHDFQTDLSQDLVASAIWL
jgi:hypothetical protein